MARDTSRAHYSGYVIWKLVPKQWKTRERKQTCPIFLPHIFIHLAFLLSFLKAEILFKCNINKYNVKKEITSLNNLAVIFLDRLRSKLRYSHGVYRAPSWLFVTWTGHRTGWQWDSRVLVTSRSYRSSHNNKLHGAGSIWNACSCSATQVFLCVYGTGTNTITRHHPQSVESTPHHVPYLSKIHMRETHSLHVSSSIQVFRARLFYELIVSPYYKSFSRTQQRMPCTVKSVTFEVRHCARKWSAPSVAYTLFGPFYSQSLPISSSLERGTNLHNKIKNCTFVRNIVRI